MSKIQDFVDGYNSKLQVELNTEIDKQTIYKTARVQTIAINEINTSGWPNSSITTIGQLFAYIFPNEDGGKKEFPQQTVSGQPNPVYFNTLALFVGNQASPTTKDLYNKLDKNYRSKLAIDRLNEAKEFGGQKWFDNFMSSALSKMSSTNVKMSEFSTPSTLEDSFNDLVENFGKNFGPILSFYYYTTIQVLYDAFIEAGENYKKPVSATQSGTQSATQ
jgi:hypothetical protein